MSEIAKKEAALNYFISELLRSKVKNYIARIILFGGVAKGKVRKDSDIDLLILATDRLKEVSEASADATLNMALEKARYDFHSRLVKEDALEIIELAKELMEILEDKIGEN